MTPTTPPEGDDMAREAGLPFQKRVLNWLMACFSNEVCRDGVERNHRYLEESLELVQSLGCTRSEARQLVDYVFNRPVGEPHQELGGAMVTLSALASCHDMDMNEAGETELARVWTKIDKIRAKQAAKPAHSPLPETATPAADGAREALVAELRHHEQDYPSLVHGPLCGQAADEIDQLRRDLSHAKAMTEVWMSRAQCGVQISDEMVQEACDTYSAVYIDDDKDMGDAMRAALKAALSSPVTDGREEKAIALLRWGTWDMTPAARLDWKNRVEEFLSSSVPSAQLGCGDPGCKDPNCDYGRGPNTDPLSSTNSPREGR